MKTHLLLLLVFLLQVFVIVPLAAQPIPCTEPVEMTPFCDQACIICSIDGFRGRHESGERGALPGDFCTTFVHNGQWIAFIAGSVDLTVDITVSNCIFNNGLEIGIYEGIDCQNFRRVSNCNTNARPGQTHRIQTNTPLTIGQYYFIAMDGSGGDNCDWVFAVVEGSTDANPLSNSGVINGNFTSCPNVSNEYSIDPEVGATIFNWTLDGVSIGDRNTPMVTIDWEQEGDYLLCVQAANACDEAEPTCRRVNVSSIPAQTFDEIICSDQSFQLNDTLELTEAGIYEFNFQSVDGCDSTIFVNLKVITASSTTVDVDICEGDALYIGTSPFTETGQYVEVLENYIGCDSIVTLDLFVIICEIEGTAEEIPVTCFGEASGIIDFFIQDGTAPFTYTWQKLDNSQAGTGTIGTINSSEQIENLAAGTYLITINDDFGNDLILIQDVTQPPLLEFDWQVSDYGGINISCFEGNDGLLEMIPMGGVAPYTYNWNTGQQTAQLQNLIAGDYMVTVTDSYGCKLVQQNTLTQASPIDFQAVFSNPGCDGLATGQIEISSVSGGTADYKYQFFNTAFQENRVQMDLTEGNYTVSVRDANGCIADTTARLTAAVIPALDLGDDKAIFLGESVKLTVESTILLDSSSLSWSNQMGLSCYNCPNPTARPFASTTYTVTGTSEDGCLGSDSITVGIIERRRVYVANIFSPNDDGVNDFLNINAGEEAMTIEVFRIFSRWGEQVYERSDFLPNITKCWDGRINNEIAEQSIYLWTAEIRFLDGVTETYSGDVMLLR